MTDVAILGATGTVGQKFITLLANHPQFTIRELGASPRSAGKKYKDACAWKQSVAIPDDVKNLTVKSTDDTLSSPLLFSGLDSSVAFEVEKQYAEAGHVVISNARNHRMEPHVPLVIPEINHEHIRAIETQKYKGAIITNPNCSAIGLCLALYPLHARFTITRVMVHTMQAISGAGYPGVPFLDIVGNVVPFISGEEEKLETETQKIFGGFAPESGFTPAPFAVSAHCNRVPVADGHTECVSVSFINSPPMKEFIKTLKTFSGFPQERGLHSAPSPLIEVIDEQDRPQPLLDVWSGGGMAVTVGRVRECSIFDYKFVLLSHNTIRGAAGAAVLNAETALAMGVLDTYL